MARSTKKQDEKKNDGSLLDERSLGMVADMAEAAGAQVWIEQVGDGGTGILIEDGQVAGAEEPAAERVVH